MKPKTLIIIGIITSIVVSVISVSLVYNQEIKLVIGLMTSDEKSEPAPDYTVPFTSYDVEKDCNNLDGRKEAQCFKDAFESCTTAVTNDVIHTIEGDPMYLIGIIRDDCKIHVTFDNSGDRFGGPDKGIRNYVCDRIELQEKYVWIIDNCIEEAEFQINYQGQEWASHEKCTNLGGEWNYDFHNCVGLPDYGTCEMNSGKPICMSSNQTGSQFAMCYHACEFVPMDRK